MSFSKKFGGVVTILIVFLVACTKLPQNPAEEGALLIEDMARTDSIPAEWGNLVSATISPENPSRVQLWFQDDKGTIHLSFYEMKQRQLAPNAVAFGRH